MFSLNFYELNFDTNGAMIDISNQTITKYNLDKTLGTTK